MKSNSPKLVNKRRRDEMYKNLEVELVRRGISKSMLAKRLGIAPQTLSNKLSGRCKITLPAVSDRG